MKTDKVFNESELKLLSSLEDSLDGRLRIVGGFVRDTLMGKKSLDIDFLVEQDLEELLEHLSQELGCDYRFFEKFRTGKLIFNREVLKGSNVLDFAQTRKESYSKSGAEPDVLPGTLEEDARRRDFGVNALRFRVEGESLEVEDDVGGREDLQKRELRILHPESFADDPARLIRAIRFSRRLDFSLEPETQKLFANSLDSEHLDKLPAFRRRSEMMKLLSEDCFFDILQYLHNQKLLKAFFGADIRVEEVRELMAKLDAYDNLGSDLRRLFAILKSSSAEEEVIKWLNIEKKHLKALKSIGSSF